VTKPKPDHLRTPHPRLLTNPIAEQPEKVRRVRARHRALSELRRRHYTEYLGIYWTQLREVELE
jgi:hypothetical protein